MCLSFCYSGYVRSLYVRPDCTSKTALPTMSKELYLLLIQGLPGLLLTGKYALPNVSANRYDSVSLVRWLVTLAKESRSMVGLTDPIPKRPGLPKPLLSYSERLARARPGRSPDTRRLPTKISQLIRLYPFLTGSLKDSVKT